MVKPTSRKGQVDMTERKESTGGDNWEQRFYDMWLIGKTSDMQRAKKFITSELTRVRDEAYKEGARVQAEMDAKVVSEVRQEVYTEIEKITKDCLSDFGTMDYDEFAEKVLKWLDGKLKS